MFIVGGFRWWYQNGWKTRVHLISNRIDATLDYFSLSLLAKSIFAPFRQISAGRVRGPLGVQLRAFTDRTISRLIGAMIRLALIFTGLIAIALQVLFGLIELILWPIVSAFPLIGIVMWIVEVQVG